MNLRNVDPDAWLLCLTWVCDIMNLTAERSLRWVPPLQVLTGQTQDNSKLEAALFWDICYVPRYRDSQYSGQIGASKSSEIRCWFVGFSPHCGHAMTFQFLTADTRKIIHRSRFRLSRCGENNLKADVDAGAIPERTYI